MSRRFQRNIEDFTCKVCGQHVKGSGYTNHCPKCLWSVHCDINPGDREESCCGLMEPIALSISHGKRSIVHRCKSCGIERKNKAAAEDDTEVLFRLPIVDSRKRSK